MSDPRSLLVGGEPSAGIGQQPIIFPFTGQPVAYAAVAGPAQLDAALRAASGALAETAASSRAERVEILSQLAAAVEREAEILAQALVLETGKTIRDARLEVKRTIATIGATASAVHEVVGEVLALDAMAGAGHRFGITVPEPVGVVAAIPAFNFPLLITAHKLAPAIGAGCPIVIKPPDQAPLAVLQLAELVIGAGWPRSAISVLPGAPELGQLLTSDDRVGFVTFTGSSAVGKLVAQQAAFKPLLLELGSNAATIVLDDADLGEAAARCCAGGFSASGQSCISVQRVYVQQGAYADFVELLAERAGRLRLGDPRSEEVDVGPVIDDQASRRIATMIANATEHRGRILVGGRVDGRMVEPTVIADLTPAMRLQREELFGPVVAVGVVKDLSEAIALANETPYGLAAGVFTESLTAANRAARELRVGNVHINDVSNWRADQMPYGGIKDSGLGKEGPRYVMEQMSHFKTVSTRILAPTGAGRNRTVASTLGEPYLTGPPARSASD